MPLEPRVVVWQIAEANDLTEARAFEQWVDAGRPPYLAHRPDPISRSDAWRARSPSHRIFATLRESKRNPWPKEGIFADAEGREHPMRFFYAPGRQQMPREHAGWPAFSNALIEGAALAREQGIELVVLLIPMKMRVMLPRTRLSERSRIIVEGYPTIGDGEDLSSWLDPLLSEHGVRFVDASPALRAAADRGELVYPPFDIHLSARGHEVVADLMVETLRR
jgi:hypothetical protein